MTYAAGILFRAGDRVLLLKRAGDCDHSGTWGLPAGKIEGGETPLAAALRESFEEIGTMPDPGGLHILHTGEQFTTFGHDLSAPFEPVLNSEHSGFVWAPLSKLPAPIHPGLAPLLLGMTQNTALDSSSVRQYDGNGWYEVQRNPISKAGVFPYSGAQLGLTGDQAQRIFHVLRPPEELATPECIDSFKLLPWVDNHTMLGPKALQQMDSALSAEQKGVHGVIGEQVFYEDGVLYGNIKTFSDSLAELIDAGKRELSAGYRCRYDFVTGIHNGQPYDAVQREIRGNHLALVKEGRMGADVAVMDQFTFSFDAKEAIMADPTKEAKDEGAGSGMTLADAIKMLGELAPQVAALQSAMAKMAGGAAPEVETVVDEAKPVVTAPAAEIEVEDKAPTAAAMDAAMKSIAALSAAQASSTKTMLADIAKRDALVSRLTPVIGAFDHAAMTSTEVALYGCKHEKIGLGDVPAASASYALDAYLKAVPKAAPVLVTVAAMDAAPTTSGLVGGFLKRVTAE